MHKVEGVLDNTCIINVTLKMKTAAFLFIIKILMKYVGIENCTFLELSATLHGYKWQQIYS